MGRPPIGKIAMTGAERVQRYREKHAAYRVYAKIEMQEQLMAAKSKIRSLKERLKVVRQYLD
jgi:hypothetical protein